MFIIGSRDSIVPANAFAARLFAISGIFGLAVFLEIRGDGPYSAREIEGLYALVLIGFMMTLAYAFLAIHARPITLKLAETIGDGFLISGLVYCTGGGQSLFGFLYVIWIVRGAMSLGPFGAILTALVAIVCYGGVIAGSLQGWLPPFEATMTISWSEALQRVSTHSVAFVAVAVLAHELARQIRKGAVELGELGEIHQRIVDNVPSGLLTVNRINEITSFNPEAERITGYPRSEIIGHQLNHVFPTLSNVRLNGSEQTEVVPPEDPMCISDSGVARGRLEFRSREGEELRLGFSLADLRDEAGSIEGRVLIFQDLTRILKLEEEVHRSERLSAVGQLAAGLAHEIRNPLASLSGAIELLAGDQTSEDPSSRRLFAIAHRETRRLDRLVSEFLVYARPESGEREPVSLISLLEEFQQLLSKGNLGDVELVIEVPKDLQVLGNPDQLRQVVWNLILNATQAEPADGAVHVRAERCPETGAAEPAAVVIEVIDQGRGIPKEQLDRALEPFFTTKATGTGLGLATVHSIVAAHDGELTIESEVTKGTIVRVRLPAALS